MWLKKIPESIEGFPAISQYIQSYSGRTPVSQFALPGFEIL
jgi:hypothetical protein